MSASAIVRFMGVFIVTFTVLMLPWLGLAESYKGLVCKMGTWCFYSEHGQREVVFLNTTDKSIHPTFAKIEIANRKLLHRDGSGPIRLVNFDVRGLAWSPTALVIALIVATPVPLRRKIWALGWGVICVQMVVLTFLGLAIWNESSEIGLVTISPFWKGIVADFQQSFITQFSMAAPVFIWVFVTFRVADFDRFLHLKKAGRLASRSKASGMSVTKS